jgi:hypothetical protein
MSIMPQLYWCTTPRDGDTIAADAQGTSPAFRRAEAAAPTA